MKPKRNIAIHDDNIRQPRETIEHVEFHIDKAVMRAAANSGVITHLDRAKGELATMRARLDRAILEREEAEAERDKAREQVVKLENVNAEHRETIRHAEHALDAIVHGATEALERQRKRYGGL